MDMFELATGEQNPYRHAGLTLAAKAFHQMTEPFQYSSNYRNVAGEDAIFKHRVDDRPHSDRWVTPFTNETYD